MASNDGELSVGDGDGYELVYFYGDVEVVMPHRQSESAVQALKQLKIEEANSECAICLQDLLVGAEAAKLPCSHVYHCGCIVKWFDRSNQCPLCRSQVV